MTEPGRKPLRGPLVISVIGRQNAGKTTVVERMVSTWTQMGLKVAGLKHDGHVEGNGPNDWEKEGSDTGRMRDAGALLTLVAGGEQTLLYTKFDDTAHDVHSLIDRLQQSARSAGHVLDVIVVEGYKASDLPKVVVLTPFDLSWLGALHLSHVRAIVQSPLYHAEKAWDDANSDLVSALKTLPGGNLSNESFTQKHPRVYHGDNLQDLCESLWLPYSQ